MADFEQLFSYPNILVSDLLHLAIRIRIDHGRNVVTAFDRNPAGRTVSPMVGICTIGLCSMIMSEQYSKFFGVVK